MYNNSSYTLPAKRKAVETPVNVIKKGIYVFPNGDKYGYNINIF